MKGLSWPLHMLNVHKYWIVHTMIVPGVVSPKFFFGYLQVNQIVFKRVFRDAKS